MATQTQTVLEQPVPAIVASDSGAPLTANLNDRNSAHYDAVSDARSDRSRKAASRLQKVIVTFQLSGVNFTMSAVNGLVVVGLPKITQDLALAPSLAFWPSSVSSLATTATLLLAGSLADVLGPRTIDLLGCFTCGALMLASGFAQTGEELVAIRALQGVGQAMHLASSVALVTKIVPRGRGRNIAFSCLGLSQPLGFSFGLVVGGVLVDTIGWRAGWYLYGGITLVLSAVGLVSLPKSAPIGSFWGVVQDVRRKVDWIGALLASSFMAFLSYFLACVASVRFEGLLTC